jgi:hypothetical protein
LDPDTESGDSEGYDGISGGVLVEVDLTKEPSAGEVLVFTVGGGFVVKGSLLDIAKRLAAEEWPVLELAESEDKIIIRSEQVIALRGGNRQRRGGIGFVHASET